MSRDTCSALFAFGTPEDGLPGRFAVPYHPVGCSDLDYGVPKALAAGDKVTLVGFGTFEVR